MSVLHITVTSETIEDYDGEAEEVKLVAGSIDGENIPEHLSVSGTETDDNAKQALRDLLTEKGYIWESEQ